MPPSHVKKEEAELRQIAKQSRTARKEAQERERKQRQRALRAAAKGGAAAAAAGASADAGADAAPKKKRGAIILPGEVQELRQRLLGENTAAQSVSNGSPSGKKKNDKKNARAASKKATGSSGASAAGSSSSSSSSFLVPSFHQEVHFKKKMFFVDVVLHHVPHQKIDISETTNSQLVVDTTAFTKKYRLVLPFPDGMRCDAAAANYDLEHGVLSCKLPILDGTLPAALAEENEKMVEKMKQQKALRFRVSQDGDLTVRTRQALLAPTPAAQAALHQAAKDAKEKKMEGDEEDKAKKKPSAKAAKRARDEAEAEAEAPEATAPAQPAKAAKKEGKKMAAEEKPAKPDVFQADHARALEAAKAAAEKVHLSMQEKMRLAKTVQASRQERLQTRSVRKERKEEQKQQSFQRVLEEQKKQLLARAAMQQAPPARAAAAKKDGAAGKSVRFAEA